MKVRHISCQVKSSWSEPRFKSHAGGKIKKTLKMLEISTFFANFQLNQVQNCSIQIKKMKGRIFSFQLKKNYFCQTLADDARHKIYPLSLIWLELWSHTIKRMIEKIPGKIGVTDTMWDKSCSLIGQNWQNTFFSKLTQKIS